MARFYQVTEHGLASPSLTHTLVLHGQKSPLQINKRPCDRADRHSVKFRQENQVSVDESREKTHQQGNLSPSGTIHFASQLGKCVCEPFGVK